MTGGRSAPRTIVHVDMDAFFVGVELLDHPELRGRPVVVGGTGRRGVVAAASYEARAHGVRSAMPSERARRLCPDAVFLAGRHHRYAEVSRRVMALCGTFSPSVEPVSLDEAFLDVTGARRVLGDGRAIAESLRAAVQSSLGLSCAVGVAPTKFVAKLASQAAKPRPGPTGPEPGAGVVVVAEDEVLGFLHPLAVSALWGVGPATLTRLERIGVYTVGDLARLPRASVVAALGDAAGSHLHALANGIDPRPVVTDRQAKSIGHEQTYPSDLVDREAVDRELLRLCDAVAARLREAGTRGRTVVVKVRFGDFRTLTRSATLPEATDASTVLRDTARSLVETVDVSPGVRLLGVSAGSLANPDAGRQLSFDELTGGRAERRRAEEVADEIRSRWGQDAIGPATLLGSEGLGVRRRGDDVWGPSEPGGTDG